MLKKIIRRLLTIILVPVVLIVLGLGYLGFVPGVSALFGSNKPKDLGAPVTEADRLSVNQKFGQEFVAPTGGQSPATLLQAASPQAVDVTVTAAELAAHFMQIHPVTGLQMRVNPDGSIEASGRIDKGKITRYLDALGVRSIDQASVLTTVNKYVPGNPIFYVKGRGSITDNKTTLSLDRAELGRLPLAAGPFAQGLVAYADLLMREVPHLDIQNLAVASGQFQVRGTDPAVMPVY